jgi:hypothetical protein
MPTYFQPTLYYNVSGTELVAETLYLNELMRLIAREDYIELLKSYMGRWHTIEYGAMVESYWQGKTDVLKKTVLEKRLHHKLHLDWPGVERGPLQWWWQAGE